MMTRCLAKVSEGKAAALVGAGIRRWTAAPPMQELPLARSLLPNLTRTSECIHLEEIAVTTTKTLQRDQGSELRGMQTPPIVSPEAWEAARQEILAKEKALTKARDALAAERRRMPWMAVEKVYTFEGPQGRVRMHDLFEGRRQLIVYRAFFEPGVFGWPEHACRGCSLGADQVGHL